jgi:hypothetical protein
LHTRLVTGCWRKCGPYFYDSQEKYERLRRIKGELDPDGLFSADDFSLKPLSITSPDLRLNFLFVIIFVL